MIMLIREDKISDTQVACMGLSSNPKQAGYQQYAHPRVDLELLYQRDQ